MLSKRLKELRSRTEYRQEDIAKKLNITKSAYGYYEQGKTTPDANTLSELSKIFNVSVDYILGNTDNMTSLNNNIDDEFTVLLNDPELLLAFKDLINLSDTDKQEIINYIKFKKNQ